MSDPGFSGLSPDERIAGNEAQHKLRERFRNVRSKAILVYLGTIFFTSFAAMIYGTSRDVSQDFVLVPLIALGLIFVPMVLYVGYGIVYLFRQGFAPQESYELTIKESKIVNSRDSSHFEVCFEELPYDWYYTYHHNGNWLDHAEMTPGTRVQATLRKRRGSRYNWYYPELAALNLP